MRTKGNRLLAGLLSILMILSLLPAGALTAFSEESVDSTITAYVSVSKNGQFVTGKDGKSVAEIPVELTGKESYTLDDALKAVHDKCYDGGSAKGYESYTHELYGLSLKTLWGDSSGMFGYQVNRGTAAVYGLDYVLSDGDYIDSYINQSAYPDNEAYAVFGKSTYNAVVGGKISLQLKQAGYDENWNTVFSPCEGATITVDGAELPVTTNSTGNAAITIDQVGTHIVSAIKTKVVDGNTVSAITAPVCVVTVTEAPRLESLNISKEWKDDGNYYELSPAFDPSITEYSLSVPDYVSSVYPYAKLAEDTEGKSVCYYGYNGMFGGFGWSSSNSINISGGYFGVVIYDKTNSMSSEDIRYTVNICKHATLTALSVDGVGNLAFNRDVNDGYHYYVDSAKDGVEITAAAYKSSYTITIGGEKAVGGEAYHLTYQWDENGKMEVPVTVSGGNAEPYTYTLILEKQPVNDRPYIMVQPSDNDYIIGEKTEDLTVVASANGELTYQWYMNTTDSAENGIAIAGATDSTYTPSSETVGTVYYYCVIANTGKTEENTAVSEAARITVDPDPTPKAVIVNPGEPLSGYGWESGYVYNVGEEADELTVKASSDAEGGTWAYNWYSVSRPYNISGWSSVSGNNTAESYTPSTELKLANSTGKYYACKVSYTFKGKTYTSWASTGETYTDGEGEAAKTYDVTGVYVFIKVKQADTPAITKQPVGASYIAGDKMSNLSVSASKTDGGQLSYQWYVNDTASNEGGTAIEGATSSSYALGTAAEGGIKYYYCVVTNTIQNYTSSVNSEAVEITVKTALDLIGDKLDGSGTLEDPYLIKNAQDYQDVADLVASGLSFKGMYLKQTADITLPDDWKPIGVRKDPSISHINNGKNMYAFSGSLDGNDQTLTVPAGGLPLLGYVQGATVKDLNIYGEKIAGYGLVNNLEGVGLSGEAICIDHVTLKSGTQTLKSGLIGTYITNNGFAGCSAGFYVTIKNCTVEKGVVIGYEGDETMIGSIAGRINGTIDNCVSYATVKGADYVGGILGTRDNAMGTCAVTNCRFEGRVEASGDHAGGIAGGGYSNSTAPNGVKITITSCESSGVVTGKDKVGGILGGDTYVVQAWNAYALKDNAFTGKVKTTGGSAVGGIIGYYGSLNKNDNITGNYYASDCGAEKGIGFVQYVDTDYDNPESADGTIYINTADGDSGVAGITKTNLNRTDDPLGADAEKLCYTDSTPATATELIVSGTYKAAYIKGEPLDLTGIVLTVLYNNGKEETISLDDVTVTGFDGTKIGQQEITLTYKGLTAALAVQVRNPEGKITVTFSVLGDSKHDCETDGEFHILKDNNLQSWVAAREYTVDANATVWDVLEEIFDANGMTYSNPTGSYIESVTHNGVTLAAADNHANSGWMFTVNGIHGSLAVNQQYMSDGDVIIFHHTDDYTFEKYENDTNDPIDDQTAAETVISLIDAIGQVTLFSGNAITQARTAYNALTDDQKALVTNLSLLTEAEIAFAKLIQASEAVEKIYQSVGSVLETSGVPTVGSIGGEWKVIGLARSGRTVDPAYYVAALQYIKENINDKEQLHRTKSTENARLILALTALGYDVTDIDGHNLLMGLTDMNYVTKQGINGPIWALIAFDVHGYAIPQNAQAGEQVTREGLIAALLDAQRSDGGWTLSGSEADPDLTAMAIQALSPYYSKDAKVKDAVENALNCLSALQTPVGGYQSQGALNSESCAQVIVALTALGIDPTTDARFIKNGCTLLDALLSFYREGGFSHTVGGDLNEMATEQSYYALTAYARLKNGQTSLYDMSDVTLSVGEKYDPSDESGTGEPPVKPADGEPVKVPPTGDGTVELVYIGVLMLAIAVTGAAVSSKKRKKQV